MKRLLLASLLFTVLVGCSSSDMNHRQRRNDCADVFSRIISRDEFIEKYKIGQKDDSKKEGYYKEQQMNNYIDKFCMFYRDK